MDSSPEINKNELHVSNYWAETSMDAQFFFVDGSYLLIVLMATINLWSSTTWLILLVSFLIFAFLAKIDLTMGELAYRFSALFAQKKYRRY